MIDLLNPMLLTALGLGLLHAFDADHVMAVSALANKNQRLSTITRYASMWAVGHGSVLIIMGLVALAFGMAFPTVVSEWAELFVGFMLIGLGIFSLRTIVVERLHIRVHSHGDIHHAHYVNQENTTNHDHRPLFVGIAHGAAGSAPALIVALSANKDNAIGAILYLVVFSFALLTSMSLFGLVLASVQQGMKKAHQRFLVSFRVLISIATIGLGFHWISG